MKCLNEKTLSSYLDEKLSEVERREIEGHIADCDTCLDMLLVAHEAQKKRFSIRPLRGLTRTISNILRARMRSSRVEKVKKKRPELKWLLAGLVFLAFSFMFRHYFLQFLAIAVILGFKWAMEGEGAKRVIMIFKGIPEKEKKFERKLPPDVSNVTGGGRYGEPE